jgi:hypothetical protein
MSRDESGEVGAIQGEAKRRGKDKRSGGEGGQKERDKKTS